MKKIILLGLISFAMFVLIKTPATFLLPYVNQLPYFQAQSITGNIFSGQMHTTGKIDSLSYQINPWQLLLANLSAEVVIKKDNSSVKARMIIDLISRKITLYDLKGVLNLKLIEQYMPALSSIEPKGNLSFKGLGVLWDDIENNPVPQRLSGTVDLLKFNVLGQNFGDYQLLIKTQLSNIIGHLSGKKSAAANVKIKLSLLAKEKQLTVSGNVASADANIKAILQQMNIGNIKQTIRY